MAFESETDQDWLIRRFALLEDILRETRAYQEMAKEGREEGLQEGLKKGKLEGLREMLLRIVQARYPSRKMLNLAKGQAAIIDDPEVLQSLILRVSLAQTIEEAQKYLIDWPGTDNEYN